METPLNFPPYTAAPGRRACRKCGHHYPRVYYFTSTGPCWDCFTPTRPIIEPAPTIGINRQSVTTIRDEHPDRFRLVIASLTLHQRAVFDLYYGGLGLTQAEVAERLGCSQQAVADAIRRIRAKFVANGLPEPLFPLPEKK